MKNKIYIPIYDEEQDDFVGSVEAVEVYENNERVLTFHTYPVGYSVSVCRGKVCFRKNPV